MPERVILTETPRDAFQGLPHFIPTETKVQHLLVLIEAGFPHIDFGSFVSPRAVPQMQDTQQVFEAVRPRLKDTYLIAVVPNVTGIERAIRCEGIRCVGYPLSLSETFQRRNLHQDLDQAWCLLEEMTGRADDAGIDLMVYLSMAFGNPYREEWSAEQVSRFVEKLVRKGIRQISLADTVGLAQPDQVEEVFTACRAGFPSVEIGVHLHSRPERWEQPVMAAYRAGCRRFDCALHGIGGCPFAEDELVGNIPTEQVVARFTEMGVATGLEEAALERPWASAGEILRNYGS